MFKKNFYRHKKNDIKHLNKMILEKKTSNLRGHDY